MFPYTSAYEKKKDKWQLVKCQSIIYLNNIKDIKIKKF